MTNKFKNQYRVSSTRLTGWPYREGGYFITICTKDRECVLSEVCNDGVHLTAIGTVVQEAWGTIPQHFDFVSLGCFVIMPNHIHGVLFLDIVGKGDVPGDEAVPRLYGQMGRISPRRGGFGGGCRIV